MSKRGHQGQLTGVVVTEEWQATGGQVLNLLTHIITYAS